MTNETERKYVLLQTKTISGQMHIGLVSRHDDFLTHQEALTMRGKMMRPAAVMLAEATDANGCAAIAAYRAYIAGEAPHRYIPVA